MLQEIPNNYNILVTDLRNVCYILSLEYWFHIVHGGSQKFNSTSDLFQD